MSGQLDTVFYSTLHQVNYQSLMVTAPMNWAICWHTLQHNELESYKRVLDDAVEPQVLVIDDRFKEVEAPVEGRGKCRRIGNDANTQYNDFWQHSFFVFLPCHNLVDLIAICIYNDNCQKRKKVCGV